MILVDECSGGVEAIMSRAESKTHFEAFCEQSANEREVLK